MLICNQLEKKYNKKTVVHNVSFHVEPGEVFALLGSNGAGKTTTIKMILDLVPRDGGTVEKPPLGKIGYSPETPYFYPFLTGEEILKFYGELQGIPGKELNRQVSDLLELAGLWGRDKKVRHYSKGMRQRLALAQALLGDPELLILDEPTAGLDAAGRLEMIHTIQKLKAAGKTIVLNSHILHDIERVCDRGIILHHGEQVYEWEAGRESRSLEEIFIEKTCGKDAEEAEDGFVKKTGRDDAGDAFLKKTGRDDPEAAFVKKTRGDDSEVVLLKKEMGEDPGCSFRKKEKSEAPQDGFLKKTGGM